MTPDRMTFESWLETHRFNELHPELVILLRRAWETSALVTKAAILTQCAKDLREERERCAKIAEECPEPADDGSMGAMYPDWRKIIAVRIRALE